MRKTLEIVGDCIHLVWYFAWRTALFLGGVVGFFFLIALMDELL